jgi:hypothetical protein
MRLYILFHHVYHVYVSTFFALFHHTFVCLCIQGTDAISPWCMFMFPRFSLYFTIFSYVYVSKVLTLFHHTDMLCIQGTGTISPYIQIIYVYVSMLSLYFTISFLYVYVSMLSFYFTIYTNHICLCIQITGTISPYMLCVYVSMFLYYFTIYINHICYVSILLTLFHHINFFTCLCIHIYMFSHMNTNSLKIVSIIL